MLLYINYKYYKDILPCLKLESLELRVVNGQ